MSLKIKFKECSLDFLLEIMSTNKHKSFNKKTIIDLHMKNWLPKKLARERHDGSGHLLYIKALQILHLLVEIKYYLSLGCAETVSSVEMTLHPLERKDPVISGVMPNSPLGASELYQEFITFSLTEIN